MCFVCVRGAVRLCVCVSVILNGIVCVCVGGGVCCYVTFCVCPSVCVHVLCVSGCVRHLMFEIVFAP